MWCPLSNFFIDQSLHPLTKFVNNRDVHYFKPQISYSHGCGMEFHEPFFSVACSKLKPLFTVFMLHNLHLEKVIFKRKSKCAAKGGKGILLSMCPQVILGKNK